MQESLKRSIAIRSVAKAHQLSAEDAINILKDKNGNQPLQPSLARGYLACISAINESEECFGAELYASLNDLGLCMEDCELAESESH